MGLISRREPQAQNWLRKLMISILRSKILARLSFWWSFMTKISRWPKHLHSISMVNLPRLGISYCKSMRPWFLGPQSFQQKENTGLRLKESKRYPGLCSSPHPKPNTVQKVYSLWDGLKIVDNLYFQVPRIGLWIKSYSYLKIVYSHFLL